MKKFYLSLAAFSICAMLLCSCKTDSSGDGVLTEEISSETLNAKYGEITADNSFMEGEWVEQSGFAFMYEDGIWHDYMSYEPLAVTFDDGEIIIDGASCGKMKASDDNTVVFSYGIDRIKAVRAESEKGREYIADLSENIIGTWIYYESNLRIEYTFDGEKLTVAYNGIHGDAYSFDMPYEWNGARIVTESTGGESITVAVRIEDDVLTLISEDESSEMYRSGSSELDASNLLQGYWVNIDSPYEQWQFFEDGTASVAGAECTYTAEKNNSGIFLTFDDGTYYFAQIRGSRITLENDSTQITLYEEGSAEIKEARKKYNLKTEKADLFERFPDMNGWLEYCDYGDIPKLADADYIQQSINEGVFLVSTPEELASFNYYVNTNAGGQYLFMQLQNDIDLDGYAWAPMGWSADANSDYPFTCLVDGSGYAIKNMTVNTNMSDAGFIGWETGCYVGNITFENASVSGGNCNGIITGQAICGVYENCHVSGQVSGSQAGSMLGYEANCTIRSCTADVTVNGELFEFLSWNEKEKSEIVIENPVEITIDENHTVTRPEVEEYSNLGWQVFYNGEEVLHRNAENELSYQYFGTSPGTYEIYLSAYVSGQYVPISNTVTYTIE